MSSTAPYAPLLTQQQQRLRGLDFVVYENTDRPGSARHVEEQPSFWNDCSCLESKRKEPMQRNIWAERSSERLCDFDLQLSQQHEERFTKIEDEVIQVVQGVSASTDDLYDQHYRLEQEKMRQERAIKIQEDALKSARKKLEQAITAMTDSASLRARTTVADVGVDPDPFTEQRVTAGKKQYMFNTKQEVMDMWSAKEEFGKAQENYKQTTEKLATAKAKLKEIDREIKKQSGGFFDRTRSAASAVKIDPETPAGPKVGSQGDSASAAQYSSDNGFLSPRCFSTPTDGFGLGTPLTAVDMEPGPHLRSPRPSETRLSSPRSRGAGSRSPVGRRAYPLGPWKDGAQSDSSRRSRLLSPLPTHAVCAVRD